MILSVSYIFLKFKLSKFDIVVQRMRYTAFTMKKKDFRVILKKGFFCSVYLLQTPMSRGADVAKFVKPVYTKLVNWHPDLLYRHANLC